MTSPTVWTIVDQLRHRDPRSLTNDERLVLAFGEIRTEVNHGGFDCYLRYLDGQSAPIAVAAARIAGCPVLADLIEAGAIQTWLLDQAAWLTGMAVTVADAVFLAGLRRLG